MVTEQLPARLSATYNWHFRLTNSCEHRDLGTEGAEDADLAVRKRIAQRIIPGPRYLCATRAIGTTGSYGMGIHRDIMIYQPFIQGRRIPPGPRLSEWMELMAWISQTEWKNVLKLSEGKSELVLTVLKYLYFVEYLDI
jgi:hypothetical protein